VFVRILLKLLRDVGNENQAPILNSLHFRNYTPLFQFIPFFKENGFDISLFISQPFINRISAGFTFDLLVTATVVIIFIISESKRLDIRKFWISIIAIFSVGVSLGLPLFLYQRESVIDKK